MGKRKQEKEEIKEREELLPTKKPKQKETSGILSNIQIEKIQRKLKGYDTYARFGLHPVVRVEVPKYSPTIISKHEGDEIIRAETLLTEGKFADAILEIEKLLNKNPKPHIKLYLYYRMGQCYVEIAQYDDAIQKLDTALKIMQNIHPYKQNGVMYDIKNIFFEFIEYKTNIFADILFSRALALKKKLDFKNSINTLDIILYEQPINVDAWILKGNSYNNIKEYNKAMECYNRALEINPDNLLARENKILLLIDLGKREEAEKVYKEGLEITPNDLQSWCIKGDQYIAQKNIKEAIKCYEEALELNPSDPIVRQKIERALLMEQKD